MPIRVGFISYGHSTRTFHLPFILPNPSYQVVAFLQRHDQGTESRTKKPAPHCEVDFPKCRRYRTADEFFADKEIDLVIVASHGDTHAEYAIRALEAGMHVVVEKPFANTSAETDQIIKAWKKTDRVLAVYQNRRYDSDFLTMQKLLDQKVFGQITEFENHYDVDAPPFLPPNPNKTYTPGAGFLFCVGVHILDQILVWFGPPVTVTGFHRSLRSSHSTIDDTFTLILGYDPKGPHPELQVTVKGHNASKLVNNLKFLVRGYEGSFIKFGEDPQANQMRKEGKASTVPEFGEEDPSIHGILTTYKQYRENQKQVGDNWVGTVPSERGSYMQYYKDLADVLEGKKGRESVVGPELPTMGIRIVELARQSAEEGRTLRFE